ncbi:hypothetical protein [Streptomyces sp. NPDC000851]
MAAAPVRSGRRRGRVGHRRRARLMDMRDFGLFAMPELEQIVAHWREYRASGS